MSMITPVHLFSPLPLAWHPTPFGSEQACLHLHPHLHSHWLLAVEIKVGCMPMGVLREVNCVWKRGFELSLHHIWLW